MVKVEKTIVLHLDTVNQIVQIVKEFLGTKTFEAKKTVGENDRRVFATNQKLTPQQTSTGQAVNVTDLGIFISTTDWVFNCYWGEVLISTKTTLSFETESRHKEKIVLLFTLQE